MLHTQISRVPGITTPHVLGRMFQNQDFTTRLGSGDGGTQSRMASACYHYIYPVWDPHALLTLLSCLPDLAGWYTAFTKI